MIGNNPNEEMLMNEKKDLRTISLICERFEALCRKTGVDAPLRMTLLMDLESAHAAPGLDLAALLDGPDADFAHDVVGIMAHMDRSTYPGTLTNCFVPRYAAQN